LKVESDFGALPVLLPPQAEAGGRRSEAIAICFRIIHLLKPEALDILICILEK
jgi:hypothetical protein